MPVSLLDTRSFDSSGLKDEPPMLVVFMNCSIEYVWEGAVGWGVESVEGAPHPNINAIAPAKSVTVLILINLSPVFWGFGSPDLHHNTRIPPRS